ncbi:MAG TPA: hypothetical protein VNX21_06330 [Candidatus Thermoplasmatota archaeon]|nr:hypothetical protein [Candidatus Thermoplasmatota archaeon]
MSSFDELLAQLLDEPEEVLASLNDVVNRGRLQADDLDAEALDILARYDLVTFLVQRTRRGPVRTWVYSTPMGLRTFAFLEKEAEREEARAPAPKPKRRSRDSGVSR